MSGRKKKLSEKLKRYNVLLIIALIVLMLLLGVLMVVMMFGKGADYKIVSRKDNIEKSRKQDNPEYETIGWVRIQGTNIDYPLYGVIKDGYDYPVSESYLWSLNMDSDFHDTMLVYGHNVMNLGPNPISHDNSFTRMEELMNFVYYDFAKENQFIQLTINGEDYLYRVFAVNFMLVESLNEYPKGEWVTADKTKYIERLVKESIYDYDVEYKDSDKVLSVVTCSRFFSNGRNYDFIVTGRLMRPGEAVRVTGVHRNRNYAEIDEIMKEAQKNEESTEDA